MTFLEKVDYRIVYKRRRELMKERGALITGHEKSSHILAGIVAATNAMMRLEVDEITKKPAAK